MPEKIYKVFISSTFEDLKEERKKVISALLSINCMPVAMEFFAGSDKEPVELINDRMEDCDYFLLIMKGKYGSIYEKSGKSFTEMEYDTALATGIPLIACVFDKPDQLTRIELEYDDMELRKKFENFSVQIKKKHTVQGWDNAENLSQGIIVSLKNTIVSSKRGGFMKGAAEKKDNTVKTFDEVVVQKKKNGYIKFVHLTKMVKDAPPVYRRYLPRINDQIDVYDEYVLFRINEFDDIVTGLISKDSSTGVVDLSILNPWQPKLKLPEGTYEQTPGDVEETIHQPSSTFITSSHYYNAFQKNQFLAIKMEKATDKARLIVDFRYIYLHNKIINEKMIEGSLITTINNVKKTKKLKIFNHIPVYGKKYEEVEGLYWINADDLKKGDVLKMDFAKAINWDEIK